MENNITSIAPKEYDVKDEVDTSISNSTENVEVEEVPETVTADPKGVNDPNAKYTKEDINSLKKTIKNLGDMVQTMESVWKASQQELKITENHIRQLYVWNEEHATKLAENATDDEIKNFDHFNGLDCITEEKLMEIFGEGHPIWGVDVVHTLDRIKGAMSDFFSWLTAMRQYREIHDQYIQLLEQSEEEEVQKLKELAAAEEDPEKKEKLKAAVEKYYYLKYMQFLADPIPQSKIERVVKLTKDAKKVEYLLTRSIDKLKQLKFSSMFIPEISQFETRMLDKKYAKNNQILLAYFMTMLVYECNFSDPNNEAANQAKSMIFGLDGIIKGTHSPHNQMIIINNLEKFEDQFLPFIPDPVSEEEEIPDEESDKADQTDSSDVNDGTEEEDTSAEASTEEVGTEETGSEDAKAEIESKLVTEFVDPFTVNCDAYPDVYVLGLDPGEHETLVNQLVLRDGQVLRVNVKGENVDLDTSEIMDRIEEGLIFNSNGIAFRITRCTSMTWEEYSEDPSSKNRYVMDLKQKGIEELGKDVRITYSDGTNTVQHVYHEWATLPVHIIKENTGDILYVGDIYRIFEPWEMEVLFRQTGHVMGIMGMELVDYDKTE